MQVPEAAAGGPARHEHRHGAAGLSGHPAPLLRVLLQIRAVRVRGPEGAQLTLFPVGQSDWTLRLRMRATIIFCLFSGMSTVVKPGQSLVVMEVAFGVNHAIMHFLLLQVVVGRGLQSQKGQQTSIRDAALRFLQVLCLLLPNF